MRQGWNPEAMTRVRLTWRVSAAVLVIDDFTGSPITGEDVVVTAAQTMEPPVHKGNGYFLFMDCSVPVLDLEVKAWAYHPAEVRVELAQLTPNRPLVRVRLTPNRNYSIPNQTTCLEGSAPPETCLRVLCTNDPRPLRLLYDYSPEGLEEGKLILLYDPHSTDLGGQQFALFRREEPQPEFFTIREELAEREGECLLTAPLRGPCKKMGAAIFPVYTARADKKGEFFLPLKRLPLRAYQCRIFWAAPGEDWQERSLELTPGTVTRLELGSAGNEVFIKGTEG